MRKLVIFIALLLTSAGVFAQSDTPDALVSLLQAGDFRAVAVTSDEQYLLVADAATNQVRIYDLDTPAAPPLVSSVDVEGTPTGLAAADSFVLVATQASDGSSTIEIIAPARYARSEIFTGGVNYVDLPFETRKLVVSPNRDFAVALGVDSYALLELNSAEEISTRVFSTELTDVALTNDLLISVAGSTLTAERLNGLENRDSVTSIDLAGEATSLAVNASGDLGAVALRNGDIAIFNNSLEILNTVSVGSTINLMQFSADRGSPRLAVVAANSNEIIVFDTSNSELQQLNSLPMEGTSTIRAMTTVSQFVITANDNAVAIYALP